MTGQQSPLPTPARANGWDERRRVAGICLVLAAIVFAVFGQTFWHDFVDYDDDVYVYENPVVARGLTRDGIIWAFSGAHADNWHPLTWLSHMLDCQLYGLHPWGHHLTNVLLHTANVIVLFLVLRQMTGSLWRSAFVAAVFAIHPLRVESVAWVAERKDVLSGLFFVLTIGAYVRYSRLPWSWGRYGLVLLLFALGLMCKPILVTLPVVLLLLDYWPLQRKETMGKLALEKLPLLALSAAGCLVTLFAQQTGIQSTGSFSLPMRLANAVVACMVYLGQMVYPKGLVAFYPYPLNGLPPWEVVLAVMLLAGFSAVAFRQRRREPWLAVGWLWYLVMLLPVVGIIQVGDQAHADRYTYLPQIGIYVAVTWLVAECGAKQQVSSAVLGGLMAGVVGLLMVCAWKQTTYWKNGEILWTHALACTSRNDVAEFNLGNALRQEGRMTDAITHYQNALQIRPNYAQANDNLGHALLQKGRVDEAIVHFQKALQTNPRMANAHFNLAKALFQKGRVDEAIAEYQNFLQLNPDSSQAHFNLGLALLQQNRVDEAISHFQNALQIRPGFVLAHTHLANALLQKGRVAEAISHFQGALQFDPANPVIQNNLAWLLATSGEASVRDGGKAVELAERANRLSGDNPFILCTLAAAYAEVGRFSDATETAQRALHLAETQSNPSLSMQLQSEMKLYQASHPYHIPEQTH